MVGTSLIDKPGYSTWSLLGRLRRRIKSVIVCITDVTFRVSIMRKGILYQVRHSVLVSVFASAGGCYFCTFHGPFAPTEERLYIHNCIITAWDFREKETESAQQDLLTERYNGYDDMSRHGLHI